MVRVVAPVADMLGECPLWDEQTETLRWLDIAGKRLWHMSGADTSAHELKVNARPACMALTYDADVLLLGFEWGLARLNSKTGDLVKLCDVEADKPYTRVNDGRCDRQGNFLFGTYDEVEAKARGAWYRYTREGVLQTLGLPPVAIPNSLCFSLDGRTLYFSDGVARCIQCCDYDPQSGRVENLRVFAEVPHGAPDGSAVDAQGYVWNAEWGNSRVVRYRSDGQIERTIAIPASQATCIAFGGHDLDTLYITSARIGLSAEQLAREPDAGALFCVQLDDVVGLPEVRWGKP